MPSTDAALPSESADLPTLTLRQRDTLKRLLLGEDERQAASALSISPSTVHSHVKELYRAFGVHSRSALVAKYFRMDRAKGHSPLGGVIKRGKQLKHRRRPIGDSKKNLRV